MSWTTISHAHEYWRSTRCLSNPPSDLDDAELFILNARPGTAKEAASILDVVCANNGDARCDGLDVVALQRVHSFLSNES